MNLIDLKPFLDDVVDSFAAVLDLDMTIINAEPIYRVSGTERYNEASPDWSKSYTMQVLQRGEPIVQLDATAYEFALPENKTSYYSLVLYPIAVQGVVEGVIVLASFTLEQQQILCAKPEKLVNYLDKTASLISAKLEQQRLLEQTTMHNHQLSAVFESVKEGLVLYSGSRGLLQVNEHAREILNLKEGNGLEHPSLEEIDKLSKTAATRKEILQKELHAQVNGRYVSALIQARPIGRQGDTVLCVINSFTELQKTITQSNFEDEASEIITHNQKMLSVCQQALQVAQSSSNVLILGESGTGKELIARSIHFKGTRKKFPFVALNCAAIPESLLESELFGYEEGAFTGARKGGKIGKFMLANTGTLFLDEIGDMPLYLQAKLLRVLSDRNVERIGASRPIPVDIRIIAATNKNLEDMIRNKEFREDLYYRLNVIELRIPPLRERMDDIPLLIEHFIAKYNQRFGKEISGISPQAQQAISAYQWRGNVRELENAVEYMVNFANENSITMSSLPAKLVGLRENSREVPPQQIATGTLREQVGRLEREILLHYGKRYGGKPSVENIRQICQELAISLATYYRKIDSILNDENNNQI